MPPKSNAQEKRRKQNAQSFEHSAQDLAVTSGQYEDPQSSFEDRIQASHDGGTNTSTRDEISGSSRSSRRATHKHSNFIMAYNFVVMILGMQIQRLQQLAKGSIQDH
jgi:hypothetical protein